MILNRFINFTFVFVAVLGVNFNIVPLDAHRLFYLYAILVLFLVYLCSRKSFFILFSSKQWSSLIFIFSFAMLSSLAVPLYSGTTDLTFFRMGVDYLLTLIFFCPVIFYFLKEKDCKIDACVDLIIKISFVQSIFILLMLLSPAFQSAMFKIITTNGAHIRVESDFRFRAVGVTGFTSYTMAVFQCFSLYLFHLLWRREQSVTQFYFSIFTFLCILTSAIISARTSFVFLLPLILLFFFTLLIKSEPSFFKRKIVFFLSFLSLFSAFLVIYLLAIDDPMLTRMVNWMFELFINFFESGTFETSSSESLKSLFFMPSEVTILFGDGHYLSPNGEYYKHTDVGFLRLILFGGLLHNLIFYSSFIFLFYINLKFVLRIYGLLTFFHLMAFFFLLFIVNIKGSIFFDGFNTIKVIMLFTFFLIMNKSKVIH